jgi:hypothetical protein
MFDVIGDAAVQQMPRMSIVGSGTEKDVIAQKAERVREARPVEKSNEGGKANLQGGGDENLHARNRLEDGKIIVEKYDEDGKLVKRDPPGYLPFGEIA